MFACGEGDSNRAAELLNYQARIDDQDEKGATALIYAALNGHSEVVGLLVARGANPNLRTAAGSTAEDIAIKKGHENVLLALRS